MPHIDFIGPDGNKWPSVTEILSILDKAWLWAWFHREVKAHGWRGWMKCKATSNRGMHLGTDVHALVYNALVTEFPALGKQPEPFIPVSAKRFLPKAQVAAGLIMDYVRKGKFIPIDLESHLVDEENKFHGSFDGIFQNTIENIRELWDFKTGSELSPTYWLQLGGYYVAHPGELEGARLVLWNKKLKKNPIQDLFLSKEQLENCGRMFKNLVEIYYFLKSKK